MIKIIIAILLFASPAFAQDIVPEVSRADLSKRLTATSPEALQKLVVMWSDNRHPIFVARKICFEALIEAKKSAEIDPAITACDRTAILGRTTSTKFIASILDTLSQRR